MLESYFIPPRRRRTESRGGFVGVDVDAGKVYRGGYVHGPLSEAEIAELVSAGYADRIVEGDPARPPRHHPDDVEL